MQDPLEDTEWNDILRQKGILPALPKEEKIWEEDAKSEEIDLDALDWLGWGTFLTSAPRGHPGMKTYMEPFPGECLTLFEKSIT